MATDYRAAAARVWRHSALETGAGDLRELVRYATLAASSHNTQPWRFELGPRSITIRPDFSRRCPAVDPDDHHLYASLGCALENLLLAARAAGLAGHVRGDANEIVVDFEQAAPERSPLFEAIPARQTTRAAYDGKPLTAAQGGAIEQAGAGPGLTVLLLTTAQLKRDVADYVVEGNTAQFADRAWADELRSWVRFNARDAVRTGDGLYGPVMGSPDVPAWLGKLFMRFAFSAAAQNRRDAAQIASSSAVLVFASAANEPRHWIEAGRAYERVALQAAALGLKTAFINQPVEVPALRQEFARYLGLGAERPDLVIRIGRGPDMPRSLRRPVAHVIVAEAGAPNESQHAGGG